MSAGITKPSSSEPISDIAAAAATHNRVKSTVRLEYFLLLTLAAGFVVTALVPAWRHLNSDFPNYYLVAQLHRHGYPLDRVYEWTWLQRQKDHLGIDVGVIAFIPLTLPSALVIEPLTHLSPLAAKRCWIVANLIVLFLIGMLLTRMTRFGARRVAILVLLAFVALRNNFVLGQMHVLVLLLLTFAAWLYFGKRHFLSGFTLALAAALKLYPGLFLLFFLFKRQWRAAAGVLVGLVGAGLVSLYVFGRDACLVYAREVLPPALRGETIDPYNPAWGSITTLLRRLFIFEPELNAAPVAHLPWLYAFLQPAVHGFLLVVFMCAIALGKEDEWKPKRDWALYLFLLLFVSSQPAGYHFVVLILSAALIAEEMIAKGYRSWARIVVCVYTLICIATLRLPSSRANGWYTLAFFPRLWLMTLMGGILLFWVFANRDSSRISLKTLGVAAAVWSVLVAGGFVSTRKHLSSEFDNYKHRLFSKDGSLFAAYPVATSDGFSASVMVPGGYTIRESREGVVAEIPRQGRDWFHPARSTASNSEWAEQASRDGSQIVRIGVAGGAGNSSASSVEIENAQEPITSQDGRLLAFFRETQGRNSLWIHAVGSSNVDNTEVAGSEYDPRDATFLPDSRLIFSSKRNNRYALYVTGISRSVELLARPDCSARYPAASPDGRWLAFSCEEKGNWNLRAMELGGGREIQLTRGECNSITPAWSLDSRKIIYATDCGRGLGLTALAEVALFP